MTMSKIKLFQKNLSLTGAEWNIVALDSFALRFSDYLYQKYELPNIISPYLSFKGINLDQFDNFFSPKLKNLLPEPFLFKDLEKIGRAHV